MKDRKKAEKIETFPGETNIKLEPIITLDTPETPQQQDIQEEVIENNFLSIEDFKDFIKRSFIQGSGIAPELFAECVDFVSEMEFTLGGDVETPIHTRLNWSAYKKSWKKKQPLYAAFLKNEDGTDWQAIVSIHDHKKNRPYSYLAPTGNGDRVYLPPVPNSIRQKIGRRYGVEIPLDGSFWEWFAQAQVPRIPTEGGKKGLSLLTQGYVSLPMYGCTCGGQEVPTPDLSRFNKDGSTWLFALDRDTQLSTKRKVNSSKKRLAEILSNQAVVCIEDIVWSAEDGKGVDDLIVNKGSGAFDVAYSLAFSRSVKQSKSGGYDDSIGEKKKTPIQSEIAATMAKKFKDHLAFNGEKGTWMCYSIDNIGIWTEEKDEMVEALIYKALLSEGFDCFSSSFVGGVTKLLKSELFIRKWDEKEAVDYLPFQDGVLEIATGQLLPHAPKYKLTWQLPRTYKHEGGWDTINNFLDEATCHDSEAKNILICFCNAVLKGRHELQKFLYILGKPGSGKGTFIRLLCSLIGKRNIVTTDLKTWNTNNFEQARAYRKRLIVFPEQAPYPEDVTKFLSLTGEDFLRLERKGKDTGDDFPYTGMTVMAGNIPAFSGQTLNAVRRRQILILFNNFVTEVKNLEPLFQSELSAFTTYLLSIPDDEVKAVLTGKHKENLLDSWETRMRVDPLAHWANYHVIADPLATTFMGNNKNECSDGREAVTFYGSYAQFCQKAGNNPLGVNHFSPNFREMLSTVWGWTFQKVESNKGIYLKGVRLRSNGLDDNTPSFDMALRSKSESGGRSGGQSGGRSGGLEPLPDKEYSQNSGQSAQVGENIAATSVVDQELVQNQPTAADESGDEEPSVNGFKAGDKVIILRHDKKPELIGTTQIVQNLGNVSVKFESGEFVYGYDHIQHANQQTESDRTPEPSTSDIKVGDTVRFNRDITLIEIEPNATKYPANLIAKAGESAEVLRLNGGYTLHLLIADSKFQCPIHWVEAVGVSDRTTIKVDDRRIIKVGDRVKILYHPNAAHGKHIGTTVEIVEPKDENGYFLSDVGLHHSPIHLEKVESSDRTPRTPEVLPSSKLDYNFWLISAEVLCLRIKTKFGPVICRATATKPIVDRAKSKCGYLCQLDWEFPDGSTFQAVDVPIEAKTGKEDFEGNAKSIIKQWVERESAKQEWKPTINKPAKFGSDIVTVVGGGGRERQIQFESGQMMKVKTSQLSKP